MATTDPVQANAGGLLAEAAGERLSELFDEHARMVYGLCRILLRDGDEAEDAAQQVFLSAHRSMLGGTEPREPAAWLAAIARRECNARIRTKMAAPLTLAVEERDAVAADVEQVASEHAEVEALCAALSELPRQQREAIILREFYGLSYEEMRTALGISGGAVESLLFRARRRLQAELKPARAASGALALPLALRDSIAAVVPGFSGAGSGGSLAKLASLPLFAKLAGAAATMTAAGTIGYVELETRDHVPAVSPPAATRVHVAKRPPAAKPAGYEKASFEPAQPTVSRSDGREDDGEEQAHESEAFEAEDDGEPAEAEGAAAEDEHAAEEKEGGGSSAEELERADSG